MSAARKAAEAALAEWEVESERAHSARRQAALYACVKALRALLAEQGAGGLSRDDAMTLIGHAEYLRRVHGETDMPRFFDGLARRILVTICAEQPLVPPPSPSYASTSTVRSDSTPAQPLPTCVNCGSNFIAPPPAPEDGTKTGSAAKWLRVWPYGDGPDHSFAVEFLASGAQYDAIEAPLPAPEVPKVRLCACAWCGASLVQDPDATHRWRCINAEQRKCVARGDWYILDDDRDYVPAYPQPAPSDAAVRQAAEAVSQTYYEIAAEAIGEDKVKAEFSRRFEERLSKRRLAKRGGE